MHVTTTDNQIIIRHQCPLCCTAHRNGRHRLCNSCGRKALAVDILGAIAAISTAALCTAALWGALAGDL